MRRQADIRDDNKITIIPEYGRQKLLTYAESFRDLADLFEGENIEAETVDDHDPEDRRDYLWHRKLQENQGLLAEHLKEMAHIMAEVARETCLYRPMGERKYRQISKLLRESGILLRNFFELEREDGHIEISLTMKTISEKYTKLGEHICVEDVSDFISVALNTRLRAARSTPQYLTPDWSTYYFVQEPDYYLLTGVAKAIKESETVSGDNYSFLEMDNGQMAMMLSDGMGSGSSACKESELVLELLEKFLEAGFSEETALKMMNSAMVIRGEDDLYSTVDICSLDLYTGCCDLYKIGAATTFLIRRDFIERVESSSLPVGVSHRMDLPHTKKQLESGDFLVMMSDGVLECLQEEDPDLAMCGILRNLVSKRPEQMAQEILEEVLERTDGTAADDMTVLVCGVWSK